MVQTIAGAQKAHSRRFGIAVEEYRYRINHGEKWCTGCKAWHEKSAFGIDRSRADGLATICAASRRRLRKERYQPKPQVDRRGRQFVMPRDGDRKQARRKVNHLVDVGLLPDPNDVACMDCGHLRRTDGRRHEYDHYLGYGTEHHEHVQVVCSSCHHARERKRNGTIQQNSLV